MTARPLSTAWTPGTWCSAQMLLLPPASATAGMPALCQCQPVPAGIRAALPWPSVIFKRPMAHFLRLNTDKHLLTQPPTSEGCGERKLDPHQKVYHHCAHLKTERQPEGFSSWLHPAQGLHLCSSRTVKGLVWCQWPNAHGIHVWKEVILD